MESLLVEQSLSPRKQIKTPKRKPYHHLNNHPQSHQMQQKLARNFPNISRQSSLNHPYPPSSFVHEFDTMTTMHGGFFFNNHPNNTSNFTAPYHHHSLASYTSLPPMFLHQNHTQKTASHQQPPLLPLPAVVRPSFRSLPPPSRGKAAPRRSPIKTKTPQNSKIVDKTVVKQENNSNRDSQVGNDKTTKEGDSDVVVNGSSPTRAHQQEIAKALLADLDGVVAMEMEKFCGSVFSLAPPPSSLPLPKFSLRRIRHKQQPPKQSCKAEAAASVAEVIVDDGATDNLFKLLRIR